MVMAMLTVTFDDDGDECGVHIAVGHLGGDFTERADNAEEQHHGFYGDCFPYRFHLMVIMVMMIILNLSDGGGNDFTGFAKW